MLRHRGVEESIPLLPGANKKVYPRLHVKAVLGAGGSRRTKALYLGGSALGLVATAPLAVGATRSLQRHPVAKRNSFVREGLEGSRDALHDRSESTFSPVPVRVRAAQAGAAGGAGWAGARLASRALRKHPHGKPALAPIAGVLAAAASVPATSRMVNRVDPEYVVTAAGVKRVKKAPKRPSSKASAYRPAPRSFQSDIAKADRQPTYLQQRGIVTAAGATPVVGALTGGIAAARYAPPGHEKSHFARQALMGPGAGLVAGAGGAYGLAHAAQRNDRVGAWSERALGQVNRAKARLPKMNTGNSKTVARARAAGTKALPKVMRGKAAPAAAVGFLGAKAAGSFAGGQASISLNQRDQKRWKQGVHKLDAAGSKRDQHKAAQRKKLNAALSTTTGIGGLASLGLLATKHKAKAVPLSIANGAIAGGNSLLYARVTRREARVADPYDPLRKSLSKRDMSRSHPNHPERQTFETQKTKLRADHAALKTRMKARNKQLFGDDDDLEKFTLQLRAAGVRTRPIPAQQVRPLRTNKTLIRLAAMDTEAKQKFFASKTGKSWMRRNGLGRVGTYSWGPADGKTNADWRKRSGFTGSPRPKNTTGYRGSGKPYAEVGKGYLPELPYKGPKHVYHQTLGRLRIIAAHPEGRFTVDSKSGTRLMHRDQIWPKKPKDNGQMDLFKGMPTFAGVGARYTTAVARAGEKAGPKVALLKPTEQSRTYKAKRVVRRFGASTATRLSGDATPFVSPLSAYAKRDDRTPLKTSVSETDAKHLVERHGLKGPLPKELDRNQRMAAYEARYVTAGGKKAEHWQRRAQRADKVKTAGLAGATAGGAAWFASRGRLGRHLGQAVHAKAPGLRRLDAKKIAHHAETVVGASAVAGGAGELYAGHARRKRSSYASAPAGVAASALRRMQAYTPEAAS